MIRMILVVLMIAILKTPGAFAQDVFERGDGTLPLKLRGDGTLPLRLRGEAVAGGSQLATQINITQATQAALTGGNASALNCQLSGANISKHSASGTVLVGLAQYTIKGICFNQDTQEMEVVAARNGNEQTFLTGRLPAPEPTSFAGRLTVTGSLPPAGRYTFSTQSIGR